MKVSVVVPAYNVEDFLPKCLDSLLSQTFSDYEIIVVNDGSQDQTGVIADEYAAKHPDIIKAFHKENGGLSDARNYGIARSCGEYLAFIDSDDYVESAFLEHMCAKAEDTDADMVICAYVTENLVSGKRDIRQKGNLSCFGSSVFDNPRLIIVNSPYAWNKIYKRELFEPDLLYPFGLTYEDLATTYALMMKANKIEKIEEPLIHYITQREGSITGQFNEKKLDVLPALELHSKRCAALDENGALHAETFLICARHIYFRLREISKYPDKNRFARFIRDAFSFLEKQHPGWQIDEAIQKLIKKDKLYLRDEDYWLERLNEKPTSHSKAKATRKKIARKILHMKRKDVLFRHAYASARNLPLRNIILFESFHGKEISDSPLALAKESSCLGYKCYFATRDTQLDIPGVKFVKMYSLRYWYLLATAKILVNSVSFPPEFRRRESQVYLNTWHGTPLKTLGKSMIHGIEDMNNIQRNFLQSSHMIFPDSHTEESMKRDYFLDDLYLGESIRCELPRNKILSDKSCRKPKAECGLDPRFKHIAYMPTWRGASSRSKNEKNAEDLSELFSAIEQELDDSTKLLVKLHALDSETVEWEDYEKIEKFPTEVSTYEALSACDALITDYSSVMFDFSLMGKPVFILAEDEKDYFAERGAYFELDELPFPVFRSRDELVRQLSKDSIFRKSASLEDFPFKFYERAEPAEIMRSLTLWKEPVVEKRINVVYGRDIKTHSDIEKLEDFVLEHVDNKEIPFAIMLDMKDFSDTLRNAIREKSSGIFRNVVVVNRKVPMTWTDSIRRLLKKPKDRISFRDEKIVESCFPKWTVQDYWVYSPNEQVRLR